MAIPSTAVWEVRPTAGNDTNGGGFVSGGSGTDYSQQNAKNTVGSDISTTDGVANGTTTFTSATANFSTAIVDNIIHINGAWYRVTARASTSSITLDRTITTATGLTLNIGGALATLNQFATNAVSSNTCYVKASGTLTVTTQFSLVSQTNITVVGYTTTRTDNGKVTWTTATNSVNLIGLNASSGFVLVNFRMSSTAGTRGYGIIGNSGGGAIAGVALVNCNLDGFNIGVRFDDTVYFQIQPLCLINTEIKNSTSHGLICADGVSLFGCYIHDNGGSGCVLQGLSSLPNSATCCTFARNTSHGMDLSSSGAQTLNVTKCNFDANTGDGIHGTSGGALTPAIVNSIFQSQGGWAINANAKPLPAAIRMYNAFRSNTSGNYSGFTAALPSIGDVTLTADPFTSAATGDYSLNATAGGGAACKGAGIPTAMPT